MSSENPTEPSPAGPGPWEGTHNAMNALAALFNRQDQQLTQQMTQLNNTMTELGTMINRFLSAQQPAQPVPMPPPPPAASPQEDGNQATPRSLGPKPAAPPVFSGAREQGRSFLTALQLNKIHYSNMDDQTAITWALSFMQGGRAGKFAERVMRHQTTSGQHRFETWQMFIDQFKSDFLPEAPENEHSVALLSGSYHQGSKSVEEYCDDFMDHIEMSGLDATNSSAGFFIVNTFRQGLNKKIDNLVANSGIGRPSDNNLKGWMDAAKKHARDNRANEALRHAHNKVSGFIPSNTRVSRATVPAQVPAPAITSLPPGIPMDIGRANKRATFVPGSTIRCRNCNEMGHFSRDCPKSHRVQTTWTDEDVAEVEEDSAARKDLTELPEDEDFAKSQG